MEKDKEVELNSPLFSCKDIIQSTNIEMVKTRCVSELYLLLQFISYFDVKLCLLGVFCEAPSFIRS